MNIAQSVEQGAGLFPDRPALIFDGRTIAYDELDQASGRIADGLRRIGVARGDRLALLLPNTPEMVVCYFAALKAGAIAVSVNPNLKDEEIGFIFEDCNPVAAVTTNALRHKLPTLAPVGTTAISSRTDSRQDIIIDGESEHDLTLIELIGSSRPATAIEMAPSDPAAIVYTSGTTGFPKGAVLSHGNVISNIKAKKRHVGIQPEDRLLLFLPLFHCFGQNAVLNSGLYSGATIVLHRQFDMARILESVADDRVTMFFGVPTTYILLLENASTQNMRSVRYYFSAAATLPLAVERRWAEKFGCVINQGYGLTETSPFASYNHQIEYRPGSIGTPIEDVEMKIISVDDGRELAPGELGEIVIRGPNVMLGYWNRPAETAEVLRNGWFHTGDIGRIDEGGYFYIEDRLKDMINVGGLKVYPAEVENVLYRHPAVAEAAVYGVPHSLLGEQVRANLVLRPDCRPDDQEIRDFCRDRLADYKVPAVVEFVDSIPKNPTGKILKRVLKEQASTASATAGSDHQIRAARERVTAEDIQEWIGTWIQENLDVTLHAIDFTRPFFDYGLDSAFAVKLAQDLTNRFGVWIEPTIAWSCPDVKSLGQRIADVVAGQVVDQRKTRQAGPKALDEWSTVESGSAESNPELRGLSEADVAELLTSEIAAIRRGKS